jgi:hypothetical protein
MTILAHTLAQMALQKTTLDYNSITLLVLLCFAEEQSSRHITDLAFSTTILERGKRS